MISSKTRKLTLAALLVGLEVILGRLGFMTPIISINFSFVPLIINAILLGPVYAAFSSGISDIIGSFLLPQGLGIYFPGYTISAFLSGLIYGLILYKKTRNFIRISVACLLTGVFVSLLLSTYWVYMMTDKGFWVLLTTRSIQVGMMIPIKIFTTYTLSYRIANLAYRNNLSEHSLD
ncbi:folate family ECF transporter S component [Enterococcus hulanensis]|uniref:folate family ECF transporter S component n=1 Tax=Enterococcus TaxID=1350 RepID=UPI000B5A22F6|nr:MULTISPECIES: folate family ECF transporter S component [Enterococcus]MBO0410164.1 folate family ECF transporter S component [Enterococcus hulanensis]OTO14664.1 hypothetical protein A5875_003821 [Enterococcus sp. 3H8_DIV0648]